MSSVTVDRHDLELLAELQRDGKLTNSTLGERIHLSTSQVSRRIQRLEETKVISHYAAILDLDVVGLGVTAFTSVTLGRHGEAQGDAFERAVADMPEVLECLSVSGEADYVLRVVTPDLASFSEFMMKRLLRLPSVVNVKSNIALKRIKQTHVLPLDHVMQPVEARRRLVFSK
ncbi:Lrp/AsnC family transcriptional regulator [Noviherbaspirillum sp. CPCC 100848]|uniref:Lrp/AsnC family transcriptional regulator n=1 Tax=Noviherbaspirillum album TaxID=3080276 RepID=A0ABU6JC70_9BURK|nr:Lrp/AsnC family transcriptional regulator [Noviherbaspirillum sp. CPCC 100848]MEC4720925.1 Lrp/AsnC family transcriptional regulator [Noviherbaspirillum sp. CPCC 100848]